MSRIGDFIYDITPGFICRGFRRIKDFPKKYRWRKQRARGILPECDCWNFHTTLVNHIQQGVKYLLREDGWVDFKNDNKQRQYRKDLEYILNWTYLYEKMLEDGPDSSDEKDWEAFKKRQAEYERVQTKAFKLIDKHLLGMWD